MGLLSANATNKPVVGALGSAGCSDVLHRFGLEVEGLIPVAGNVLDELEGIRMLHVVLGEVGCHLQWRVHRDVEGQLSADGGVDVRAIGTIHLKDTRRVVHRTSLQSCEGQDGRVARACATESLILRAAC